MSESASNAPPKSFGEQQKVLARIREEIGKVVVGQERVVDRLLLAMLCNGHVLIEGVPGLAKTLLVSTLAKTLSVAFNRIQFTPDLLPGDLVGTLVFNPKSGEFTTQKGPIFANILLADEINRSPAKVQSALLEAMQERQVSIGDETFKLDEPFMVLATQNPIEQEGTYPLPEAQLDRFVFLRQIATGYSNLEFNLLDGKRGRRASYLENALAVLLETEAATAVNNCAAALVLTLRTLISEEKNEVIVSRGELVEIGGGFRIPDVLETSGAKLVEVGATNKTHLKDYAGAITDRTALILKVHRSNFYLGGFTD
ncbi:MAG: AAA family ATPase, partial [Verrucomicrobiota bacterium]